MINAKGRQVIVALYVWGGDLTAILNLMRERAIKLQSTADDPLFDTPVTIDLTEQNRPELDTRGVKLSGAIGTGNTVTIDANQPCLDLTLDLATSKNSHVIIGKTKPATMTLKIRGQDQIACFSGLSNRQGHNRLTMVMHGTGSLLHFGSEFTSVSSTIALFGDERLCSFGPDCMLSWSINIINYDQHTIFALDDGAVLNGPTDMRIGQHVWIGQDVLFTRGFSVGDGSIIGARALVAGDVPAKSLAVGVPARVVRSDVSWTRAWLGDRAAIDTIRALAAEFASQKIPPN